MGMRHWRLAGLILLAFTGSAAAATAPPGATALCRDGTFSFAQHHAGACSHHGGVATWLDGSSAAPAGSAGNAAGRSVRLARRSRTSACVRGALPDRRCSPGAYSSGLTTQVICSPAFRTGPIRNVPQSEKSAVEREYGMAVRAYGRSLEIDHIVSLELGGSNDIANLFPERGSGSANYHDKDKLENRLHRMVCAGELTLRAAQRGIAADWKALYRRIFDASP